MTLVRLFESRGISDIGNDAIRYNRYKVECEGVACCYKRSFVISVAQMSVLSFGANNKQKPDLFNFLSTYVIKKQNLNTNDPFFLLLSLFLILKEFPSKEAETVDTNIRPNFTA
jgi:hypothetical protein